MMSSTSSPGDSAPAVDESGLSLATRLLGNVGPAVVETDSYRQEWILEVANAIEMYTADALTKQMMGLNDEQVIAAAVRDYGSAAAAVQKTHDTQLTVYKALIDSYKRERAELKDKLYRIKAALADPSEVLVGNLMATASHFQPFSTSYVACILKLIASKIDKMAIEE